MITFSNMTHDEFIRANAAEASTPLEKELFERLEQASGAAEQNAIELEATTDELEATTDELEATTDELDTMLENLTAAQTDLDKLKMEVNYDE